MPSSPSPPAWAPKPTASFVASSHGPPVRGLMPKAITEQTSPPEHAGTRSGMPSASALSMTSPPSRPVHSVNVGIGGTACITDPSLVTMRSGRKLPAVTGQSGVVNALNTRQLNASVIPRGRLIGPLTSSALSVQSTIISSSVTVTVTAIFTGRSRSMPSWST